MKYSNRVLPPSIGDDRLKIFLSNLDGRIDTEDLNKFFNPFGKIEHIESWTPKSAIILYSDIQSIDRVLSKHRKCIINNQEIFIRRFRYGYIERAYMDSTVLFIQPSIKNSSIEWNDLIIRHCFQKYEMNIKQIRIVLKSYHGYIHFNDYDIVDRILLEKNMFNINGILIEMKRAKCNEDDIDIEKLIKKNKLLKRQIQQQENDSHDEIKYLKSKIKKLKNELLDAKFRYK